MNEPEETTNAPVRCERDRLLSWLREVLSGADGVNVHIVVEDVDDARSSVRITLHDLPGPLAGLELQKPA